MANIFRQIISMVIWYHEKVSDPQQLARIYQGLDFYANDTFISLFQNESFMRKSVDFLDKLFREYSSVSEE